MRDVDVKFIKQLEGITLEEFARDVNLSSQVYECLSQAGITNLMHLDTTFKEQLKLLLNLSNLGHENMAEILEKKSMYIAKLTNPGDKPKNTKKSTLDIIGTGSKLGNIGQKSGQRMKNNRTI